MQYQLRIYTVLDGAMADWIEEWIQHVYPLREQFGFKVIGGSVTEGTDTFVWILGYDGPEGIDAADAAYYAWPDRAQVSPNPARHLAATEHRTMHSVLPE